MSDAAMSAHHRGPVALRAAVGAMWLALSLYAVAITAFGQAMGTGVQIATGLAAVWLPVVVASLAVRGRAPARPHARLAAAAIAAFTCGLTLYGAQIAVSGSAPYPSPGDAGYLAFYLLLGVALTRQVRSFGPATSIAVDAPLAALGVLCALSVPLAPVMQRATEGRLTPGLAFSLVYPLLDLLFLAAIIGAAFVVGLPVPGRWLWLAVGLTSFAVSDVLFALTLVQQVDLLSSGGQLGYGIGTASIAQWVVQATTGTSGDAPRPRDTADRRLLRAAVVSAVMATSAVVAMLVANLAGPLAPGSTVLAAATVATLGIRSVVAFVQLSGTAALRRQAQTDDLTGLANRRALRHLATAALTDTSWPHALIALDLDGFKEVNDTWGHEVGDLLLTVLAARIEGAVREGDVVARMGGDEFAVLLPRTGAADADAVVRRIVASLSEPTDVAGARSATTASVGVAVAPTDGTDLVSLQRAADRRMYRAKQALPVGHAGSGVS